MKSPDIDRHRWCSRDHDPPISPSEIISGGAPNYYEFYDGLGRQVFLAATARF